MKQLEVQIMGQSYVLTCPQNGEQHLRQAVARVDSAMCKIRDLGKVKSRDRIAVLAALNVAFELMEALPGSTAAAAAEAAPVQEVRQPVPITTEQPFSPASETGHSITPHQLENLLQRLNTALGANSWPY
jgi:cell division protein ZapA